MEQENVQTAQINQPLEKEWEALAGKRIILSGIDGKEYQAFFQGLVGISARTGIGIRVIDGTENALDGDLMILFARPQDAERNELSQAVREEVQSKKKKGGWDAPFEDPEKNYTWKKDPGSWKRAGENWQETLELLAKLGEAARIHPQAVLLVSGNEAYGKIFGLPHALKENEFGYVSHTDSEDSTAQCLRTAEHFACSLAKEQDFPVRIARIGAVPDGDELITLLRNCVKVLLYGKNGEIYNLSAEEPEKAEAGDEADRNAAASEKNRTAESVHGTDAEQNPEAQNRQRPEAVKQTEVIGSDAVSKIREKKASDRKIIQFPSDSAAEAVPKQEEERKKPKVEEFEKPEAPSPFLDGESSHSRLAPVDFVTNTEKAEKLGK